MLLVLDQGVCDGKGDCTGPTCLGVGGTRGFPVSFGAWMLRPYGGLWSLPAF